MTETKPLTAALLAALVKPIDDHILETVGAFDPTTVSARAEDELDEMIERFAFNATQDQIDSLSRPAKCALRRRTLAAAIAARMSPDSVILEIPQSSDEAQMRVYAVLALHRRPEDLLRAMRRAIH